MNDQSRIDLTNRATTWLLQQIDAGVPPATAVQEFDLAPEAAEAVVRQAEVYLRCFDRLALILAGLAPQALIEAAASPESLADYLGRHEGEDGGRR
jgi:hypothetical protein